MAYQNYNQQSYAHQQPPSQPAYHQPTQHQQHSGAYSNDGHGYYSTEDLASAYTHDNADAYSTHSARTYGSTAHLNEQPRVNYPPVPTLDRQYHQPQQQHSQYAQASPYGEKYADNNNSGYFAAQPTTPYGGGSPAGYGHMKEKLFRNRSVKHVELQQGNLVLDCPVPQSILTYAKNYGSTGGEEFQKMRYTAVTCDPDDFVRQKYTLRQTMYGRKTELAIVMTMYNEDEKLFDNTMTAVTKNIQHFQSRTKSKTWGASSWEKIVVVVVADGRSKINHKTLKMLGCLGAYQDGIAKDTVAGKDVQAHIFEYSSQVTVDSQGNVAGGIAPVQIIFVLKEQNKKKLNSHRWFYNAICQTLNPNVTILIDVGTRPGGDSLYKLWKVFDKHSYVGGACGEITVDTGRGCGNLLNPLVAAQNFEYKMSNILDKPLESIFGYISVLPGAFSAYRYAALKGAPLQAYFEGEKMHEPGYKGSAFDANMYLAEDRILCFEIVTKKSEAWTLRYVKSAKASTDVPSTVAEYISQRRRWLNGSFFAALHATINFYRIWTSGHNLLRCLWLQIEFIYNAANMLLTWIAPANFYLSFFYLATSATSDPDHDPFGGHGEDVLSLLVNAYISLLFVILVCALGNRPQGSRFAYTGTIVFFALLFGVALYCAGWSVYWAVPHNIEGWKDVSGLFDRPGFTNIVISLGSTYGLYVYSSLIHLEPWHLITSFIQYMILLPSTINILGIYSLSNLHDISWGTKGSTTIKDLGGAKKSGKDGKDTVEIEVPTSKEDVDAMFLAMRKDLSVQTVEVKQKRDASTKQEDHMRNFRTNVLLAYLGTNMVLVLFFTSQFFLSWVSKTTGERKIRTNPYMVFIFWAVAGSAAIRAVGSTIYLLLRLVGH